MIRHFTKKEFLAAIKSAKSNAEVNICACFFRSEIMEQLIINKQPLEWDTAISIEQDGKEIILMTEYS